MTSDRCEGHIDTPANFAIAGIPLTINGWAVSMTPFRTLSATIDGQVLENCEWGTSRPGLVRAKPDFPRAGNSGFQCVGVVLPNSGNVELVVRGITDTGEELFVHRNITVFSSIESLIEHLRQSNPETSTQVAFCSSQLIEAGKLDDAERLLSFAVTRTAKNGDLLSTLARLHVARREWDQGLRRWAQVRSGFPKNSAGYVGLSNMLMELGCYEAADAEAARALELFPETAEVASQYALTALRRGDWAAAEGRFELVRKKFPEQPMGWTGGIETQIRHGSVDGADALFGAIPPSLEQNPSVIQLANKYRAWRTGILQEKLLQDTLDDDLDTSEPSASIGIVGASDSIIDSFESLGDNCELGFVQRHFGKEPLGLLRWANVPFELLLEALSCRFEGVGKPENTQLVVAQNHEWLVKDNRFDFTMHTFIFSNVGDDEKRLYAQQCRRLSFLARKLVDDLVAAEKIFVYKRDPALTKDQVQNLYSALQEYGPNKLLYLRLEDAQHPSGLVEVLDKRLFVGRIARFAPAFDVPRAEFSSWKQVLDCAHNIAFRKSN